jgi:hypothetical protein
MKAKEEPKQETVEEALLLMRNAPMTFVPNKRMYSEEDMRGMYDKSCGLIGLSLLNDQTENDSRFKKLLEQFKKK